MSKRRVTVLVAVLVVAVAAIATAVFHRRRAPEPVYEGQPLHYYLQAYEAALGAKTQSIRSRGEANDAIYIMGTNAIPALLGMLRARDFPFQSNLVAVLKNLRIPGISFTPAEVRQRQALEGFAAVGIKGAIAIPQLTEIYDDANDFHSQIEITWALGSMGPAARDSVPLLLRATTNPCEVVRINAAWALGSIHAAPVASVPALSRCLSDSSPWVRRTAARALVVFGSDAQPAIPALADLSNKERLANPSGSRSAGSGLVFMRGGWGLAREFWGGMAYCASTNFPLPPPSDTADVAGEALWELDPSAAAKTDIKRPQKAPW